MWNSALSEKFNFCFSWVFLLLLTKISFWQGDWTLGYHSMRFSHFSGFSYFPKILSLKSFRNSWGNSYIPCLYVIVTYRFTCGERKIWWNIRKSQNVMKMILAFKWHWHLILFFVIRTYTILANCFKNNRLYNL